MGVLPVGIIFGTPVSHLVFCLTITSLISCYLYHLEACKRHTALQRSWQDSVHFRASVLNLSFQTIERHPFSYVRLAVKQPRRHKLHLPSYEQVEGLPDCVISGL